MVRRGPKAFFFPLKTFFALATWRVNPEWLFSLILLAEQKTMLTTVVEIEPHNVALRVDPVR
jgi:hypothetical protein